MSQPARFLLFSYCCFFAARLGSSSVGPVFINPAVASTAAPSEQSTQGSYVTQTVYGFLDFTTTIGNTVMVFSPQSAAPPPDANKEKAPEPVVNAVIDSKPAVTVEKESSVTINPSKTLPKEKKASEPNKKAISIVQVQSNTPAPPSSRVEIKSEPSSKVNVVEAVSSIVNVASKEPIISSKVEVVAASPVKKVPTPQHSIITKVEVVSGTSNPDPVPILSSHVEVYEGPSSSIVTPPPIVSSVVEILNNDEPAVIIGNNIGEPEYDFLSRQPSEVVEETYKVINLKPSSKFHLKPRPSHDAKNKANAQTNRADSLHPTGLVTKLGGTVVKDGTTTVHETSVIGTYISGKYAQVLQSTSHVVNNHQKAKINPSQTLRILKTAAPSLGKSNKHHRHLEPTPAASINEETALPVESLFNAGNQNSIRSTRKPGGGAFKPRFKNRPRDLDDDDIEQEIVPHSHKKLQKIRPTQASRNFKHHTTAHRTPKFARSSAKHPTTVSVHSEQPTAPAHGPGKRYNSRRNKQARASTAAPDNSSNGFTRRGYKPKVQASSVEQSSASTSVYKFKLNRTPGRWQYKTTPKPRVTIRKQNDDEYENSGTTPNSVQEGSSQNNDYVTPQSRSDDVDGLIGSESVASIIDDESSTENRVDNPFPLETIKVEISTPPDFKDIYYEIATIKSPYTFQVGSVKNTRYITVTSTFEKSLDNTIDQTVAPTASEPLTENILATSSHYEKDNNFLDSSIATLPPVFIASDAETPPLETLTETFSTTQTMLKTHILPVVRGGNETSSYTLVQTYLITRLVTATKTLPPMEAYHFIPSKTLNEFNSHLDEAGSELHLELEFGDNNEQDDEGHVRKAFPADLDLAKIGSDFDLSDVDRSKLEAHLRSKKAHPPTTPKPTLNDVVQTPNLSPEQLQQLALLRLLNPGAAPPQGQVITTSKPVVKVETVYESHVIPIINGANTILSTISKVVGTVTKTDYELGTSVLPGLPIQPLQNIQPIPQVNPLFPQQPQFALTSSPVVHNTILTETNSKILKLTFGAKTAYTTIFSTKLVPTLVTSYMTTSVPVQATAAFPGYFPAPYPPFPYVG